MLFKLTHVDKLHGFRFYLQFVNKTSSKMLVCLQVYFIVIMVITKSKSHIGPVLYRYYFFPIQTVQGVFQGVG